MTHVSLRIAAAAGMLLALGACTKSTSPLYGSNGGNGGTTTAAPLRLGPFGLGQSARFTFTESGLFGYHCIPHRDMGMTGSVVVDAGGADSALVQIGATGLNFTPSTVHLKTGGSVRWVNVSSSTVHTVTSD